MSRKHDQVKKGVKAFGGAGLSGFKFETTPR